MLMIYNGREEVDVECFSRAKQLFVFEFGCYCWFLALLLSLLLALNVSKIKSS